MTINTIRGKSLVDSAGMTFLAACDFVLPSQDKTVVGESGTLPVTVVEMTQLALGRKSCRTMIRLSSLSVILLVTAEAVNFIHHKSRLSMALDTVESPVDALQRIAGYCYVIPLVWRDILPGECGVAVGTVAAKP